jgi:hypothetical protein
MRGCEVSNRPAHINNCIRKGSVKSHARVSISPQNMRSKASKGIRWMPWRQVPMKDVVHCEKLW